MLFKSVEYENKRYIFTFYYENEFGRMLYEDTIKHFCNIRGWYLSGEKDDRAYRTCVAVLEPIDLDLTSHLRFHRIACDKCSFKKRDSINHDTNIIAVYNFYKNEYIYAYIERSKLNLTGYGTLTVTSVDEIKKLMNEGVSAMYPTKIIFSNEMTVCIWPDGTKTFAKVSKEDRDIWDPKYGVLLCVAKKQFGKGGTARLHDIFNAVDAVFADNDTKPVINLDTKGRVKKNEK